MHTVRRTLLLAGLGVALATLATCGGANHPRATENTAATDVDQSSDTAKPSVDQAVALFDRLATVMDLDDARGLAEIADPTGGIRIWQRPGASMNIMGRMLRDGGTPQQQIANSDLSSYYKDDYRRELAGGIRSALAIADIDPANPDAPKYRVDCAGGASLATHPTLDPHGYPYFVEDGTPLDRDLADVAYVLSWHSSIEVWLVARAGHLYVSDVFVDSPCDA